MSDIINPVEYETGTSIRDYNIIDITQKMDGYEVILDIHLDSGYAFSRAKLEISKEDLEGYETEKIEEAIKYALGFFS